MVATNDTDERDQSARTYMSPTQLTTYAHAATVFLP